MSVNTAHEWIPSLDPLPIYFSWVNNLFCTKPLDNNIVKSQSESEYQFNTCTLVSTTITDEAQNADPGLSDNNSECQD